MQKAQKSQRKAVKAPKVAKKVTKTAKRNLSTAPKRKVAQPKAQPKFVAPQPQQQKMSFATQRPQRPQLSLSSPLTSSVSKKVVLTAPLQPLQALSKRNMSVLIGTKVKSLVPCDPRFMDDEVISLYNPKTNMVEPVIVAVPDISFEWLFSSPCDLHTFDVIPVVKDCIDPSNPVFESMDA